MLWKYYAKYIILIKFRKAKICIYHARGTQTKLAITPLCNTIETHTQAYNNPETFPFQKIYGNKCCQGGATNSIFKPSPAWSPRLKMQKDAAWCRISLVRSWQKYMAFE